MSEKETLTFEGNMDAALRRYYRRKGATLRDPAVLPDASRMDIPFDKWLEVEADGLSDEGIGDYEMRQRCIGARALLKFLKAKGLEMEAIMKQLFVAGRAVCDEYFSGLSMTEAALMFSEGKAAHSWRCKVLSGTIELAGMKGSRLPGQKTKDATPKYRAAQKGNRNRRGKVGRRSRRKETLNPVTTSNGYSEPTH